MNNRLRWVATLVMLMVVLSLSQSLQAQSWSDTQKEVWSNVETYWGLFAKGDAEGMLGYFHSEYIGWDVNEPLPSDKASTRKGLAHFLSKNSIVLHEIKPVAIQVHGNIAIVHYYYNMTIKNTEGKESTTGGRWTDILSKQGNKWVLIGDHGGRSGN
ncbi:MAG: hypothetical protein Kow0042_27950 [Calditrichia bacterium]